MKIYIDLLIIYQSCWGGGGKRTGKIGRNYADPAFLNFISVRGRGRVWKEKTLWSKYLMLQFLVLSWKSKQIGSTGDRTIIQMYNMPLFISSVAGVNMIFLAAIQEGHHFLCEDYSDQEQTINNFLVCQFVNHTLRQIT